jgi:hypothetical protein
VPPVPPTSLPGEVHIATDQEATTLDYLFAVRDGLLWRRDVQGGPWTRVGSGLPERASPFFDPPARIERVWGDGSFVIALGDNGRFYKLRWGTLGVTGWGTLWSAGKGDFTWSQDWGFPLKLGGPLTLNVAPAPRALAMSSKTKFNEGHYDDLSAYPHWLDFGCDTFFALGFDGSVIHFADPWLPEGFADKALLSPNHGHVRGATLAVSASALLLLDEQGRVWTRFWDFDISGEDHYFFSYVWSAEQPSGWLTFRLPLPDWVLQPPVPGPVGARVAVVTHPEVGGNGSRELRVAGLDASGASGYWSKGISPFEPWAFHPTGEPVTVLVPRPPAAGLGEAAPRVWTGRGDAAVGPETVPAELGEFSPWAWQPTTVWLGPGRALRLVLHTHEVLNADGSVSMKGALFPGQAAPAGDAARWAQALFAGKPHVQVRLQRVGGKIEVWPEEGEAFRFVFQTTQGRE